MEFCTAGELQRVRMNRTVLQMRRKMKMTGMRISFLCYGGAGLEGRGSREDGPVLRERGVLWGAGRDKD